MLTGLGLRNFKAFGDEMQEAPLSKITLIYGPNSGGKSSIIQALLLLKQSHDGYYNQGTLELIPRGRYVDLGSFPALVHNHEVDSDIGIRVKYDASNRASRGAMFTARRRQSSRRYSSPAGTWTGDIDLKFEAATKLEGANSEDIAELSWVSYFLENGRERNSHFNIQLDLDKSNNELSNEYHAETARYNWHDSVSIKSYAAYAATNAELYIPALLRNRDGEPPLPKDADEWHDLLSDFHFESVPESYGLPYGLRKDGEDTRRFLPSTRPPMSLPIMNGYHYHLEDITYLGPLRSAPERLYRLLGEDDATDGITGIQGEFSANVLYRSEEVLGAVNDWFAAFDIPYDIDVVKLGEMPLSGEYITIALTDKRTNTQVTLADVGYGINQILPVIIEGIASEEGSILCVEQPEIHLHPRLQANIADLMIDTIADERGKRKQWIVETHSELLITRLQRRIREGKIKPEDISVLYVDPNVESVEGSAIKVLRLGEDSYFKDPWPDGFFADALNEELQPYERSSADEDVNVLDELFSE